MLSLEKFTKLVNIAPLVAIELIIKYSKGVLLGRREKQPAKGHWFVPGGRILKKETIDKALYRIALKEIGLEKGKKDFNFVGVFEHFYGDSNVSDNISTHYVVLAFELECERSLRFLPKTGHDEYCFFSLNHLRNSTLVHRNTKEYFNSEGVA